MLRQVFYPYEHIDDWEKFNATSLLKKKIIYSFLSMEDTADAYYAQTKRVCKVLE